MMRNIQIGLTSESGEVFAEEEIDRSGYDSIMKTPFFINGKISMILLDLRESSQNATLEIRDKAKNVLYSSGVKTKGSTYTIMIERPLRPQLDFCLTYASALTKRQTTPIHIYFEELR